MKNQEKLIIITGPSGVGKGTVIKEVLNMNDKFWLSISATTRKARQGEINGEHYYFLSKEEFQEMIKDNLLLEWAEFAGNYYGTPLESIRKKIENDNKVILEIEVEGARQIKEKFPNSLSIFILPPNIKELENRIRNRATENEASITKRLDRSKFEISCSKNFDFIITNENIEETVKMVYHIIKN
ncbi:MAG: guanylate kinase [Prochlorococcus sp. SP3034]|nr:guanylate kinase [Prochlorococcus sp. SP3034]|tara:strand:- start:5283 stop:5837 length:555 start_codon:yes stop_codon:yes gene_type:complete